MILTWWLMPYHQEISGWGISAFWDAMPSVNDKVVPKSSPGSLSPDPLDAGNCWKLSHNYPAWDMVKLVGQGRGYCCHSSNWWGRHPRRDLLKEKVEWSRPCSLTKVDKEPRERQVQVLNEIVQQPTWVRDVRSASPWRRVQEFRAMGEVQQVHKGSAKCMDLQVPRQYRQIRGFHYISLHLESLQKRLSQGK